MTTKVTVKDLAKHLNLSHTTVSRVLSRQPNSFISQETTRRVMEAAVDMGYRPNQIARALRTGRTRTVCLWLQTIYVPYVSMVAYHALEAARADHYALNISNMDGGPSVAEAFGPFGPAEGILALEGADMVSAYLDSDPLHQVPVVSLGGHCHRSGDYVSLDLGQGARDAVAHLVQSGRNRVAYLLPSRGNAVGDSRYDAYTELIIGSGRTPEYIVAPSSNRPAAAESLKRYIAEMGLPDAIFCYNDDMVIAANRVLREGGVEVGRQVALVGCDGIPETEYHHPRLSTILLPIEEMCKTAWEFLQNRINDPQLPSQQIVLPTKLAIRASSSAS